MTVRRCAACEAIALHHVRDQEIRGGALEHWECAECHTRVSVVSIGTALLVVLMGLFFVGAALFSDRFSGSAEEIAIMRVGLTIFGVGLLAFVAGKRALFERRSPPRGPG